MEDLASKNMRRLVGRSVKAARALRSGPVGADVELDEPGLIRLREVEHLCRDTERSAGTRRNTIMLLTCEGDTSRDAEGRRETVVSALENRQGMDAGA